MSIVTNKLKKLLLDNGADLVGIGDMSEIDSTLRRNMPYGICIALAIPAGIINGISAKPTMDYYNAYLELNEKLDSLVLMGADYLVKCGYSAYAQTREVVSLGESEYNSVLPHKTIATRAGIGWIGKGALLVTKEYGSAIRISTILTNALLETDNPINESKCNTCMICTNNCPGEAIKGYNWNVNSIREDIFDAIKCKNKAREISLNTMNKKITLCGKCIYICPYTQNYITSKIK